MSQRAASGDLVDKPTDAELIVLQLIADDLSIHEISERLYVSENTIRSHRRALYRKLGVHSREEAVARATAVRSCIPRNHPGDSPAIHGMSQGPAPCCRYERSDLRADG